MKLEREVDRLYELPLGEFTAARNELAGRLRKDGDREAADEVKALKKPSEPAWAVNQLARSNKREVNALLKAGERLRDAQLGGGGRDKLRAAIADEREQVGRLAALAEPLLGPRPGPKLERVRSALHAAATDEPTREAIAAGRLVEDVEAIGLGPFGLSTAEAAAPAPTKRSGGGRAKGKTKKSEDDAPKRGAKPKRDDDRARRDRERLAAAARKALRTLETARQREKDARQRADAARHELGRLRDEADEVAKALQGAERRAKEAEARESDAQDKLAAAEEAAREHV